MSRKTTCPAAGREEQTVLVLERKWWTLIGVCTAIFMLLLDITVVNVALPDIQRSLHASFSDLQWVVDAYALTLAAFLVTSGVVGDMFGRREVFTVGLGVFSLASLMCGLSTSSLMLDLARAVQGVGGAVMFATSLALVAGAFQGRDRGTAFGVFGAVMGIAIAVGPLVGGAITSGIGWRWIFFVNIPIGVFAVIVTLTQMTESKGPGRRRIDWIGFISFAASLFMLVFALVRGNSSGWGSPQIMGLLVGAALFMTVFIVAEVRQSEPMLDLSLFRRPAMIGASISAFTLSASLFALFLYLTLYIQDDLGYSPLGAGVRFLPITLLSFVVAPIAGKLTVKLHARYLLGSGLVLVGVGQLLMATTHPESGWTQLLPGFVVAGAGVGMVNPVLASSAVAVVPPRRSGMASGANSTFRQVGLATGIAGLGAVFQTKIVHTTLASLSATSLGRQVVSYGGSKLTQALTAGQVQAVARSPQLPGVARTALLHAYRIGFSATLNELMLIGGIVALIGAALSYVLVRQRDFVATGIAGAAPAAMESQTEPGSRNPVGVGTVGAGTGRSGEAPGAAS
jgi:EmrB/QacA subfamily drug resistance transporter